MSDGDALLRAILLNPAEDAPRLVYADWLQENKGHAGEMCARFIRDQVWLWATPSCGSCTGPEWASGKPCPECREREERRGRTAVEMFGRERWLEWSRPANRCVPDGAHWDDHIHFSRGFVSDVICTLAAFKRHAKELFESQPIEHVRLCDIRPTPVTTDDNRIEWTYFIGSLETGYHLPQEIYFRLQGDWRHSQEAAISALAPACVAYGRSLAGLAARAG
jgi:uncharacterized protein (TIGR02996 family)